MAGRIPQQFIDDLLDRADIVDIVDSRVKLRKSGKNYSALCPFHDEKTPSFSVNGEKQFYYCFGCGAGGNALGFLMDYERLDFPAAIEKLATMYGLEVPREAQTVDTQFSRRRKNLYDLMERAAGFYQTQLEQHPQRRAANEYLRKRGLNRDIIERFGIGFAPAGWSNLMKALIQNEEDQNMLLEAGMLIRNDAGKIYDRFRDRIMFPIRDPRGRVIAFGGRVLGDEKPKYLNSPETPIFHKGKELYGLYETRKFSRNLRRVVIVEGYMDVVALAQFDIDYATATLGTATSAEHLNLVLRQVPEVIFCFDGDEAGRKAAARALENALPVMKDGVQARFLFLPEGEDPDTLVRSKGSPYFEGLLDRAMPLEEFLFEHAGNGLDTSTLDGKARLSTLATPLIEKIPDGIFRSLLLGELSSRTGVSEEKLQQLIERHQQVQADRQQLQQNADQAHGQNKSQSKGQSHNKVQHNQGGVQHHGPEDYTPPDYDYPGDDRHYDHGFDHNYDQNYPDQHGPRQRPVRDGNEWHRQQGREILQNPVRLALSLLILHPQLAQEVESIDSLVHEDPDFALLQNLMALLKRHPNSDTHMILGHFHGGEEGERLAAYAALEPLIPDTGFAQEFRGIIEHLRERERRSQAQQARADLEQIPFRDMSAEQKKAYLLAISGSSPNKG